MTEFRYWWHIWDVNAVSSCSNIKDVDDENCQNRRQHWRSQFYSIDWNWMLVTVLNLMVPYVLKGDVYGQRWKNVNHNVYLWDTNFLYTFCGDNCQISNQHFYLVDTVSKTFRLQMWCYIPDEANPSLGLIPGFLGFFNLENETWI